MPRAGLHPAWAGQLLSPFPSLVLLLLLLLLLPCPVLLAVALAAAFAAAGAAWCLHGDPLLQLLTCLSRARTACLANCWR